MEKEIYFDKNGILAENNNFLLRTPQADDKDGYIRLCIEIAIAPGIYGDKEFRDHTSTFWCFIFITLSMVDKHSVIFNCSSAQGTGISIDSTFEI